MTTRHLNIHEAKTQLSKLIRELGEGDEVIIANRGNPVAKLTSLQRPRGRRPLGQLEGVGALTDETLGGLGPLTRDDALDEIGWPR